MKSRTRRKREDPAVTAARLSAAASWKIAKLTAAVTLVGTATTGGIAVTTASGDEVPEKGGKGCSSTPAETADGLDTYDRMLRQGTITIKQHKALKTDAIEDQVADVPVKNCTT